MFRGEREIRRTVTMALAALAIVPATAEALKISEFRVRGPNGANDEFVEIYNEASTPLTIQTDDGSAGFAVVASNGVARAVIPNGTQIPARGHWLAVNSVGYSLASYPAGNGTTATGDATYIENIPDNAGIALFDTANPANFTLANRLDAVGSTSEANTLYKEGTGYPALTPFSIDYSFYRDYRPDETPKDTNNNAADFVFVDTNGTSAGAGQRLGAPGPENMSSPILGTGGVTVSLLEPTVSVNAPPNQVRDFTSVPAQNSTFGTLDIRRRVTNNTGDPLTRLRFRISDLTTFPVPSGTADLRPRTSTEIVVQTIGGQVTVQGTTLEQPPSQPNGSGYNGTMSAPTVTLAQPLAPGASLPIHILLGIQQTGFVRFCASVESLPGATDTLKVAGFTDSTPGSNPGCDEPETTIDTGPGEATTIDDATPTFAFSSSLPNSTFECSIDAPDNFQPCTTPFTTPALSDAQHTFKVRAIDEEGDIETVPTTRTFTVNAPPETTIDSGPAGGSTIQDTTPTFTFSSNEQGATFECSIDAPDNFQACTTPFTTPSLSNGQHVFKVRAVEGQEIDPTPAQRTFTVASGGGGSAIPLPAIANLVATAGLASVTLNWDDVPAATSYRVFRKLATGTFPTEPTTVVAVSQFTDSGLLAAVPQCYRIQASNGVAESPLSGEVCATPSGTIITPPPRPAFEVTDAAPAGKRRVRLDVASTGGEIEIAIRARAAGRRFSGGRLGRAVAAGETTVRIPLSRKVRRARKTGRVRLTLTLTFTPQAGGDPIVRTARVSLRRVR